MTLKKKKGDVGQRIRQRGYNRRDVNKRKQTKRQGKNYSKQTVPRNQIRMKDKWP